MKYIFLIIFILISCSKKEPVISKFNTSTSTVNTGCLSVDTDGDGILDCEDQDIDNDSYLNENDRFPLDPNEWKDSDGDGVGDNSDWNNSDPTEWKDYDQDGIGDNKDTDDDGDGVPDIFEKPYLRNNVLDFFDIDNDLLGRSIDEDDDGDGTPDVFDDLPYLNGSFDIDNDIKPNFNDLDMDGDTVLNVADDFPFKSSEWVDTDLDRLGNNIDPDDDNDGFPDSWEEYPLKNAYMFDSDHDSFSNVDDVFPFDPNEWADWDNDGVGDNSDAFPQNNLEWKDTDFDGVGDNSDADIDNDGYVNCVPVDLNTTADCNRDIFPFDFQEWSDTDLDGIGNNADSDDDNDGVPDVFDNFPLNYLNFSDVDNDGVPDTYFPASLGQALDLPEGSVFFIYDTDLDNDGVPNIFDKFPFNPVEFADIDNDLIGNNLDLDDDNDGFLDVIDKFPFDKLEWYDADLDKIGDNADSDDDNDGVPDVFDALQFNPAGFSDYNNDRIPDQQANDIDGDSYFNGSLSCQEITENGVLIISCNYYGSNDAFIFDHLEWKDNDEDRVGDNKDTDDDNDGVPDIFDTFPVLANAYFDLDSDGTPDNQDFDLDNDGVNNSQLICTEDPNTHYISCQYSTHYCEEINGTNYCSPLDVYVFDNRYKYDLDEDTIPDAIDQDIDGDGYSNCIPVDINSTESCNQDELPYINSTHNFVSAKYNTIDYCKDRTEANVTCYHVQYDRDEDGLTDFQEYQYRTNPLLADTDGDSASDFAEIFVDGTDPNDANDFADTDQDGITDSLDKTPKGAFDKDSLITQIYNSGQCISHDSEEACIDLETGLCYWDETSSECKSEPIIVTQDIDVDECIKMKGNVRITGLNGYEKINFLPSTGTSLTCNIDDLKLIDMLPDSVINLDSIEIIGRTFKNLIYSESSELNIFNTGIISTNKDMGQLLIFNNKDNGILTIEKSTLNAGAMQGIQNAPEATIMSKGISVKADILAIKGSILGCNMNTRIDYADGFTCMQFEVNTGEVYASLLFSLDSIDPNITTNSTTSNFLVGTSFAMDLTRNFSIGKALTISDFGGTDQEYTLTKLNIHNFDQTQSYELNGETIVVNEPEYDDEGNLKDYYLFSYSDLFTEEDPTRLVCPDRYLEGQLDLINPAFFNEYLSYETGNGIVSEYNDSIVYTNSVTEHSLYINRRSILNEPIYAEDPDTGNLTEIDSIDKGDFSTEDIFNEWYDPKINTISLYNYPELVHYANESIQVNPEQIDNVGFGKVMDIQTKVKNSDGQVISTINNLPDDFYELDLTISTGDVILDKTLVFNVLMYNADTGELYKNFNISYDSESSIFYPSQSTGDTVNAVVKADFIGKPFHLVTKITEDSFSNLLLVIEIPRMSEVVSIDDIEFYKAQYFNYFTAGLSKKMCNE